MRRVFPVLLFFILAVALVAGCSRQPPPHIGEWETEIHAGLRQVIWGENYIFLENGDIKFVQLYIDKPKSVTIGTYKVDYSKDPIQIDIRWGNGTLRYGIIRFIGGNKGLMEMELTTPESKERPIRLAEDTMWLTKKTKK